MAKPLMPDDLIDTTSTDDLEPKLKTPRTPKAEAAKYSKSLTFMMSDARHRRWRKALIDNNRTGQELLTELVDKWMDRMEKKAKRGLGGVDSEE